MSMKKKNEDAIPRAVGRKAAASASPVFLVKPAIKSLGLDYLHISLIVLVLVLAVFAFSLSSFKQAPQQQLQSCGYGLNPDGSCITPLHSGKEALAAAERLIADYAYTNSSLSLLPYYSLVNESKVSYLNASKEWLVVVPYDDPLNGEVLNISFILYDSNLSLSEPFLEMVKPLSLHNNTVVHPGVVSIYGRTSCASNSTVPVYLFTDPYAPGAFSSIRTAINASKAYGSKVNMSYFFIFAGNSAQFYNSYGVNSTQAMGRYLMCASRQSEFGAYVSNLSRVFYGSPVSGTTLSQLAAGAGFNMSLFGSCLQDSSSTMDSQASLSKLYGVVSTPEFVVGCKYSTIPQRLDSAINYTISG